MPSLNCTLTKGVTGQFSSRPTTAILLLYLISFNTLIWGNWTMLRIFKTMRIFEVKLSENWIEMTRAKSKTLCFECEIFPNLLQHLMPSWWWFPEGCGTCRKWSLIRGSGSLGAGLQVLHPEWGSNEQLLISHHHDFPAMRTDITIWTVSQINSSPLPKQSPTKFY